MDIVEKIKKIMKDRNISEYRLAQESNVPQSTLSSVFRRRSSISIPTLQDLCDYFDISMSQFFFDPEQETLYPVTGNQQEMLEKWLTLTPEQQQIVMDLIRYMNDNK